MLKSILIGIGFAAIGWIISGILILLLEESSRGAATFAWGSYLCCVIVICTRMFNKK